MAKKKPTPKRTTKLVLSATEAAAKLREAKKATRWGGEGKTGTAPHLLIDAKAGTGKTTTLIEGMRFVMGGVPRIRGTEQQKDIWEAMAKDGKPGSMAFMAFNKSIAEELQKRVPTGTTAGTLHSAGFQAVKKGFDCVRRMGKYAVEKKKISYMLEVITGKDLYELRKHDNLMVNAVCQLVDKARLTLAGKWDDGYSITERELSALVERFDIEVGGQWSDICMLTCECLDRCFNLEEQERPHIDFCDQLWLPVVRKLAVYRYEVLLVDEAQDLNACQQAFAMMSGERLMLCGDPRQAIYAFAGADSDSMPNMQARLSETERGCEVYPLNVTFRCGTAIVAKAQEVVPDYFAAEGNPPGEVKDVSDVLLDDQLQNGDMVVCRVNAPLVSRAFRLISKGKTANIIGKDLGDDLERLVKSFKADDAGHLMELADQWYQQECQKISRMKRPDEEKLIYLADKKECLFALCEGCGSVDEVLKRIKTIFVENSTGGIRLSSIHKAKGLEADRVYILCPEKIPHPMAKTPEARRQEQNLKYVAITRAKHLLAWCV